MTTDEALTRLTESSADAVGGVLEKLDPGAARTGGVQIHARGSDPLASLAGPVIVASASYVDGAGGGTLFAITAKGAQRLAAAMRGTEPHEDAEAEHAAVGDAAHQLLAAAAAAMSGVLGQPVAISPPETRLLAEATGLEDDGAGVHVVSATFTFAGEPCRLVQLVPEAFALRLIPDASLADALHQVTVRLSAELGRTRMPIGRLVDLPAGQIVELDRDVEEAIDLYVNGRRFALGRLLVDDAGAWTVRIDELLLEPAEAA